MHSHNDKCTNFGSSSLKSQTLVVSKACISLKYRILFKPTPLNIKWLLFSYSGRRFVAKSRNIYGTEIPFETWEYKHALRIFRKVRFPQRPTLPSFPLFLYISSHHLSLSLSLSLSPSIYLSWGHFASLSCPKQPHWPGRNPSLCVLGRSNSRSRWVMHVIFKLEFGSGVIARIG